MGQPAFVQTATSTALVGQTIAATLAGQVAGNCNVVSFAYTGTAIGITSVQDGSGNSYTLIRTDTDGTLGLSTYFLPKIPGGSNTVTVTFTGSVTLQSLTLSEFSALGLDVQIVDVTGTGQGVGATATSASVTNLFPSDLVYSAVNTTLGGVTVGAGYTLRASAGNSGTEDKTVATVGALTSTFGLTAGTWVIQIICFRQDSPTADITPVGAATSFVQTTWGGPNGGGGTQMTLWDSNQYFAVGASPIRVLVAIIGPPRRSGSPREAG